MSIPPFLFSLLSNIISPSGPSAKLSILIYHRVLNQADPLQPGVDVVDTALFDWQMRILRQYFNPLPLSTAIAHLKKGTLPNRSVCVTFDDGYADNISEALPILKRHNIHSTFFIATAFLNGGIMWNDSIIEVIRRVESKVLDLTRIGLESYKVSNGQEKNISKAKLLSTLKYYDDQKRDQMINQIVDIAKVILPKDLMMTSNQVRMLSDAGMEMGGHTINHPILTTIDHDKVTQEIRDGKMQLEEIINQKINLFAYPNGKPNQDYTSEHANIVKQLGFTAAVSTSYGITHQHTDLFQLPRFTPWDRTELKFLIRMMRNYYAEVEFAK